MNSVVLVFVTLPSFGTAAICHPPHPPPKKNGIKNPPLLLSTLYFSNVNLPEFTPQTTPYRARSGSQFFTHLYPLLHSLQYLYCTLQLRSKFASFLAGLLNLLPERQGRAHQRASDAVLCHVIHAFSKEIIRCKIPQAKIKGRVSTILYGLRILRDSRAQLVMSNLSAG
jgi:hypothetical protein